MFYSVLYEIIDRIMENKTGKIGNWTEIQGAFGAINLNRSLGIVDTVTIFYIIIIIIIND